MADRTEFFDISSTQRVESFPTVSTVHAVCGIPNQTTRKLCGKKKSKDHFSSLVIISQIHPKFSSLLRLHSLVNFSPLSSLLSVALKKLLGRRKKKKKKKKKTMLIATVLLALLFIASFVYILLNFQPKKGFASWLQPLFTRRASQESPPAAALGTAKSSRGAAAHKRAELRDVFATFDKNKDGFVTKEELKESLKNIGLYMSEKEVADMFANVDSNGDGLIDLDEFCELFVAAAGGGEGAAGVVEGGEVGVVEGVGGEEEGDLKEAFDVFDGDRDGLISVEELGMVLNSLGMKEGKRLENCKEMIRKVDMDGDGMVNFDEFKRMMKAGGRLIAT